MRPRDMLNKVIKIVSKEAQPTLYNCISVYIEFSEKSNNDISL